MIKAVTRTLALAASTALTLLAPAYAQEQTFRITQVFAATHWHWTQGMKVFTEAVKEASGGEIDFQVYHAGQLGKESTSLVTSGLADMGLLVPSYESEKLPLSTVVELPGMHSTACEGTARFWSIAQAGGALYEKEFKPLGIRPLYVILLPNYQLMTADKKIETLDDLAGLKIRANGAAMDKTVRVLGAVPVRVTSNELYDALSRGTVDGSFWIIGSTKMVGLENLLGHTVQGPQLGSGGTFFAISERVWEDLDEKTQQILLAAGQKTQQHLCEYLDSTDQIVTDEMVRDGQLEVVRLSDEQSKLWADRVSPVADDWAKEMDSTGRPGTELLQAYRDTTAD